MKFTFAVILVLLASLAHAASPTRRSDKQDPQAGYAAVNVNGRPLSGPNGSARVAAGKVLVPVQAVASALGASASFDPVQRRIGVQRSNGNTAVFDIQLGQVRENGAVVLSVSGSGEIALSSRIEELMLPAEIAAALFDVSIRFDARQNAVLVNSGSASSPVRTKGDRGFAELYRADYEYTLNKYSSSSWHSLGLNAVGRISDGRFRFTSNSTSARGPISLRRVSFDLERPNRHRFSAGDFTGGIGVPFLTANLRGVGAEVPIHGATLAVFAGRGTSGAADPLSFRTYSFDTTLFSAYVTRSLFSKRLDVSAGALDFSGRSTSGSYATASGNYSGVKLRLQADVASGEFRRSANAPLTPASAIDLTGTFQLSGSLAFQGRFARTGANFITPQAGIRDLHNINAAGVTWSPTKWLTASVNTSSARRHDGQGGTDSFTTASLAVTPAAGKPRIYFSHTQNSSLLVRSGEFTLVSASQDLRRWHLYANATRVKTIGPATFNAQFGANISINDSNSLEVSQGIGSRGAYNGMFDWRASNLSTQRLSFTAGAGYSHSYKGKLTTFERVTSSFTLPRESSVQLSYVRTNAGPTLLVSIRGTLFKKRAAASFINSGIEQANNFSSVSGRVFQDVNENGFYDVGVDKPQANVKVRIDGNRYVEADANGVYRFDAIAAGEHKVYLDLLSVRADLTLLDGGMRELVVAGGHDASLDFRLVRTGRIRGRVWLDVNSNGKLDEDERPLPDVRVLASSGSDTLTDVDGYFTLSDLVPGEHAILIDEKTLPEKIVSASRTLSVTVFAGRETCDVVLFATERPAEVKRFGQRTN